MATTSTSARDPVALPIDDVLARIVAAVDAEHSAVVVAEPGSGKTTRVPPALAAAFDGRIVVLEPRRVAARSMARFLAATRGEAVGDSIGLTTRDERRVGAATRIEFVTEGVLTRRLQRDPELTGVAAVVFDEFHERSLPADTGLALCLDARALRDDLRLVVMSATIEPAPVSALLHGAPVITAAGRTFPVEVRHRPPAPGTAPAEALATTVVEALAATGGDVLAFLPGAPEIHAAARALQRTSTAMTAGGRPVDVHLLHGRLSGADQDRALAAAPTGRRKVVLATNVAETSVTVAGITAVVDSGLVRRARTVGIAGFTRLGTERATRAEVAQRTGRAGRLAPGVAFRLWAERDEASLVAAPRPDILTADLTGLALDLAAWGVADAQQLRWLDPPPEAALAQGRRVLADLGLIDGDGRPTAAGRQVLRLGVSPRIGAVLLAGRQGGPAATRVAVQLAALLEDGDPWRGRAARADADVSARLDDPTARSLLRPRAEALARRLARLDGSAGRSRTGGADRSAADRSAADRSAADRSAADRSAADRGTLDVGSLLLAGMADRVALRRADQPGRYVLRHGGGLRLPADDPLARCELLVVADAGGDGAEGEPTIRLAAPIERAALPAGAIGLELSWDRTIGDGGDVAARRVERLDALVLRSSPASVDDAPGDAAVAALLEGVRSVGLALLGHGAEAQALQRRVAFCRQVAATTTGTMSGPLGWPDLSDPTLLVTADRWLAPYLAGARRRRDLAAVDLAAILRARLDRAQLDALDRLAPVAVEIPTGRRVAIDYGGERPTLRVKLQELFGCRALAPLADGAVALVVELLSPAGRVVAVTDDLGRFWSGAYQQVRSELRGRYPKHPWPADPLAAPPTARTTRAARRS